MSTKLVAAALFAVAGFSTSGCLIVDHHDDVFFDDAVVTSIDADTMLDAPLGEGAGVFVEYYTGGTWVVWTTCDTLVTGNGCAWDISVRSHSYIDGLASVDHEGFDRVDVVDSTAVVFYAETFNHTDAIELNASPDEALELDVYLDGLPANDFLVWFGDGVVHNGAYGAPVVFVP